MIRYRKGYKYQLHETYQVEVDSHLWPTWADREAPIEAADGMLRLHAEPNRNGHIWLTIKRGYAWDGPSGPTIDTQNWMRGSLIHDALYQMMRENAIAFDSANRIQADVECLKALKEDGMWALRRAFVWAGLRVFASYAASPEHARKIFTAPAAKYIQIRKAA